MTQHAFRQTNTDRIYANQWQKAPNYGMILIAILEPFLKRVPRYERKRKDSRGRVLRNAEIQEGYLRNCSRIN